MALSLPDAEWTHVDWRTDATQSRPYQRHTEKGVKRGSGKLVGGRSPRHNRNPQPSTLYPNLSTILRVDVEDVDDVVVTEDFRAER